ncbi:MAG: ComEA family DNA-binding protein [Ruminococcus sp.]|jgi:competence protein ComEA|nr:ComEA family DNA-binding protein [Ruminococcus sp.]
MKKRIISAVIIAVTLLTCFVLAVLHTDTQTKLPVMNSVYYGDDYVIARDDEIITVNGTAERIDAADYVPSVEAPRKTKVNINTANADLLITLDGIGEKTAEGIISYRNENGLFLYIEDLCNVPGIGEAKFNAIKDNITVGEIEIIKTLPPVTSTAVTTIITTETTNPPETTTSATVLLININTASKEELIKLPGIGEVIAGRIVEYAETVGFKSPEDIMNVSGIGEAKFNDIKAFIYVD